MLEAPTTESATTTSAWDWPPGGAPGGQRPVEDVVAEVGRLDGVREMIAVRAVCRGGGDPHAGGAPRQAHAGWPLASRVRRLRCAPRTWCGPRRALERLSSQPLEFDPALVQVLTQCTGEDRSPDRAS